LCVWIVKAFVSIMYKKLHIEKYLSSQESLSSKGSFLVWVPEKFIMVTNFTLYILDLITIFMLNRKAKYILRLMMSFYVVLRRMNIE